VLLAVLAAPTAVVNGYLAALTAVASATARPGPRGARASGGASHRIAVLVPAHDEERIIGETIDSILAQQYPRPAFAVHVVADNCTDRTAALAREHGAVVHERVDLVAPGKGPALGWLLERVLAEDQPPDGVVILDADTIMSPRFLAEADAALGGDGSAWQAYYGVREPELSTATAVRQAALILRHYVRPLGRTALGASCGLFGNGMLFRAELLRNRRFSAHLTEDVEFQLELLLEGERVGFLPDAVVEAEMPTTLEGARTQNERWELGRLQLARRFVPDLVRRAIRGGGAGRTAYLDATLDQLTPPLSVLAAGTGVLAGAGTAVALATGFRRGRTATVLSWLSAGALAFHVIAGLRVARAPRAVYQALLQAPRVVAWKVVLWLRVLVRPASVTWRRTERNPAG
jgi:cellulose synthase/poly-beta-1,6-N-acetylglucosamine synthase-like glycosyltransferase